MIICISIDNKLFPENLKHINKSPKKIYVEGNINLLNKPAIAVVGSRCYSDYGKRKCILFTTELVKRNFVIVSGMAKGIDSIAHNICIQNGGKTIAILPSGLSNIYPKENKKLYYDIITSGGAVLTEYDMNERVDSSKFLERNRLVSGLAIGTLVIEAGYRSGTRVTARLTLEQGKKLFCVPINKESIKGIINNEIIKGGGISVNCINDIIKEIPIELLP